MANQEDSFVLGVYRDGSDKVDVYFNNEKNEADREMLNFYYRQQATDARGLYAVHIWCYTVRVRFKESFQIEALYERGKKGRQEGNLHRIFLYESCVLMCGTTYATLERQLEVLKERLFYDTFQEEMGRLCEGIESVVVLDFELDYERLFKDWIFEHSKHDQYHTLVKYSELPSATSRLVKVVTSIKSFDDITVEEEEDDDFDVRIMISTKLIVVRVYSDRSNFVKTHSKLCALFNTYRL